MLKKYISKFTIDILPSIVATIVGAYIVNHYIIPKAGADRPAAAAAAVPDGKAPEKTATAKAMTAKASAARPAETSSDVANVPDATTAKGIDKPVVEKASIDKSDKPETASLPTEQRRHQPVPRDTKAVAKVTPAPVMPAAVAPALATVGTAPANDGSADERRDANDLARAAIERLSRSEPRTQEAVRTPEASRAPEAPRLQETPRVQEVVRTVPAQQMQQLPPPIVVATPSIENPNMGSQAPDQQAEQSGFRRPRPPGDIPTALPLDLQANAAGTPRPERTNVAEDVLSAAKSVFNSVIPHPFDR
jgi:hypothetical protein